MVLWTNQRSSTLRSSVQEADETKRYMFCSPHKSNQRFSRGFTLIELLVSMTILVLLTLLLGQIFSGSTKAWARTNRDTEVNNNGRALLDFIARELSTAIADRNITFRLDSDIGTQGPFATKEYPYGNRVDAIWLVSADEDPDYVANHRTVRQLGYFVSRMKDDDNNWMSQPRFRLVREMRNDITGGEFDAYKYPTVDWTDIGSDMRNTINNSPFGAGADKTIADNVAAFEIWAYPEFGEPDKPNYFSGDVADKLPAWVDLYIELLAEADAIKAADIADSDVQAKFVQKNSHAFIRRVYFMHRTGYNER